MELNVTKIIDAYTKGQSMTSIAKEFHTYPTTINRILTKNNIEIRDDGKKKNTFYVEDGEKLIEWAKSQGRLVTKAELAKQLGKARLSPSYFLKYPELGQYVEARKRKEIQVYTDILYKWLQANGILYKPGDRTKLDVTLDALLLGEYSNIAIQVVEKPFTLSKKIHQERISSLVERAKEEGLELVLLDKNKIEELNKTNELKCLLDSLKK